MSSIQDLETRLAMIESEIIQLKSEWKVRTKLSIGSETDKQVVIEDGKVDGRHISEDAKILIDDNSTLLTLGKSVDTLNSVLQKIGSDIQQLQDKNNSEIIPHLSKKNNPHSVTTTQIKALPVAGGTVSGNLTVSKNLKTTTASVTGSATVAGTLKTTTASVTGSATVAGTLKTKKLTTNEGINIGKNLELDRTNSIDFGEEAWIGHATNITADKRTWMHLGGYKRGGKRYLAIYADPIYVSGSLFVKGGIVTGAREENNGFVGNAVSHARHTHGPPFVRSSKSLKKNITPIDLEFAQEIVENLRAVKFTYKQDEDGRENLGFLSEEVPDILSDKDHKTVKLMEIIASLVTVVQNQQKDIDLLKNSSNLI